MAVAGSGGRSWELMSMILSHSHGRSSGKHYDGSCSWSCAQLPDPGAGITGRKIDGRSS